MLESEHYIHKNILNDYFAIISDYESIKLYYSDRIHASMTFGFRYTVNECYFKINTFQVYHIKQDARYKRFHSSKKKLILFQMKNNFLLLNKIGCKKSE